MTVRKPTLLVLALAGGAAILAGCGRMGELAEPGPVEPGTVNRPSSQQPIDGGPGNPFGGTAAGREPQ